MSAIDSIIAQEATVTSKSPLRVNGRRDSSPGWRTQAHLVVRPSRILLWGVPVCCFQHAAKAECQGTTGPGPGQQCRCRCQHQARGTQPLYSCPIYTWGVHSHRTHVRYTHPNVISMCISGLCPMAVYLDVYIGPVSDARVPPSHCTCGSYTHPPPRSICCPTGCPTNLAQEAMPTWGTIWRMGAFSWGTSLGIRMK